MKHNPALAGKMNDTGERADKQKSVMKALATTKQERQTALPLLNPKQCHIPEVTHTLEKRMILEERAAPT